MRRMSLSPTSAPSRMALGELTYLSLCFLICKNGDNNSMHIRIVVRIKCDDECNLLSAIPDTLKTL